MTYNEITFLAKEKKITMSRLASEIGFSRVGLKDSSEKMTMPWAKIVVMCQFLSVTPNELLGWQSEHGNGNYAANISGGNTQNSNEAINVIAQQLDKKDKEIDRLLRIIEKKK